MSKTQFKYNPTTLNYEKVELSTLDRFKKALLFIGTGLFFAAVILGLAYSFYDSPKEKALKEENVALLDQYEVLTERLNRLDMVMEDMEERDDNVYRAIFEAEPIDPNKRKSGVGGVNRYKYLEGRISSALTIDLNQRLDKLSKRMVVESKSLDEVIELAKNKEKMLSSIPAIQPVANKDLKRMASGFGYRIDPHYKVSKHHDGMDFTASTGTEIYATGDGKVTRADNNSSGYGNHIRIDHGYGYVTLYAHLSKINVRAGQKVKRGDIIGLVGNTGKSMGSHLHYEVRKESVPINPINFYFNDLTPEEYEMMIELSNNATQSFD
ncbi:MAG: murein DD-endopeptidase MepM/ murein hydrolase activator NlpD [Patiriisocius sp.]|jgi:murein DD-endopeptidase MepM/ murein hydrolase activator NlpD